VRLADGDFLTDEGLGLRAEGLVDGAVELARRIVRDVQQLDGGGRVCRQGEQGRRDQRRETEETA